jgi:hypothetical protein
VVIISLIVKTSSGYFLISTFRKIRPFLFPSINPAPGKSIAAFSVRKGSRDEKSRAFNESNTNLDNSAIDFDPTIGIFI